MPKQFISRVRDRQSGPLSFEQEGLWFLNQLDPTSPRYNVSRALRLRGNLAIGSLQAALDEIVQRHQALRSRFTGVSGIPMQVVGKDVSVPITLIDLSDKADREERLGSIFEEQIQRPFDLSADLMLRACLVRLTESDHVLLLVVPHITCDGWSLVILLREFLSFYETFVAGQTPSLPELPIQYLDYVAWQRQWLTGEVLDRQLGYWRDKLSGVSLLDLPADHLRTVTQGSRNGARALRLSKKLSDQLKALSRTEKSTFFMTLLAAFQALLYRYTNQSDIVVGFPIANRRFIEIEGLIGFFANTLVLRSDLSGNPTFRELLARVKEGALAAYEHQDLPFEKLVQELQPERDLSRNPLFQVAFQLRNYPQQLERIAGLTAEPIELRSGIAKFDLSLAMKEAADGLTAEFEYSVDLFESASIARMLSHLETLLRTIVTNPERRLSELALLTEAERRQLLVEWNQTKRVFPKDKCIHQLFEEQVKRTPEAIAVVFEDQQLTYGELNSRANQLAHYLMKLGVGPEVLVGICVERSFETIIGLLGILKAGGAYVPMDPKYPKERLGFMLEDTHVGFVLTDVVSLTSLPLTGTRVICLDRDWEEIARGRQVNPISRSTADGLAYVIYTSGSTGGPKGVAVSHRGVNRLVMNTDYAQVTPSQVMAQVSNVSFDAATFEIWGALLNGARLVLIGQETLLSPQAMSQAIERNGITTLFLTTALFNQMVEQIPAALGRLRYLLFGGEAVDPERVRRLLFEGAPKHLLHVYGPTEATTFASWYRIEAVAVDAMTIAIGRSIANTEIYILDAYLNQVPIGVAGELYIGGDGLARGYLKRPELTAEKFIPHPFSSEPGARLYKTGDRSRYLPDGNIEFLGRVDDQVKIRGFRIELGEIEAVLNRHPKVRDTVVIAREDSPGDKRLAAYVVGKSDEQPQADELKQFLKARLPDYMMPSAWVVLASLPHTPNGKINRAALPAPEAGQFEVNGEFTAPRTAVEKTLARVWAEVLKLERVGIHDNFFDLGGHSLLATQVVSRLGNSFNAEIPLRTLFESPTIAQMAAVIMENQEKQLGEEELEYMRGELESLPDEGAQPLLAEEFMSKSEGDRHE